MYVLSAIRSTLYAIRATSDEIALYICRDIITFVGRALQISLFMQNKPNLLDVQMNVNKVLTKDYENKTLGERGKNKANSKPIKPNFPDTQMNVSKVLTKDYENIANCKLCENKANTNPIQTQTKPISPFMSPFCFSFFSAPPIIWPRIPGILQLLF